MTKSNRRGAARLAEHPDSISISCLVPRSLVARLDVYTRLMPARPSGTRALRADTVRALLEAALSARGI